MVVSALPFAVPRGNDNLAVTSQCAREEESRVLSKCRRRASLRAIHGPAVGGEALANLVAGVENAEMLLRKRHGETLPDRPGHGQPPTEMSALTRSGDVRCHLTNIPGTCRPSLAAQSLARGDARIGFTCVVQVALADRDGDRAGEVGGVVRTETAGLVAQPPSGSATGGKGGKRCLWQNRACRVERLLGK